MAKRSKKNDKDTIFVNEQIRSEKVRVITDDREMLGVMPVSEALSIAKERGLDLVEVSPNADPPVCKIIDYGKYSYQEEKKKKEAKKKQKTVHLKEIKMRPKTDIHDYNFKVKHIKEFLNSGDRVKVTIRFRGREMAFKESGYEQLNKILEDTKEIADVSGKPEMEGRNLSVKLAPKVSAK